MLSLRSNWRGPHLRLATRRIVQARFLGNEVLVAGQFETLILDSPSHPERDGLFAGEETVELKDLCPVRHLFGAAV